MASMNKQSIILNFNPNINSDNAYNFSQAANQQLELSENTEVALYKAYLQRKAIVIPEDETIEFEFKNAIDRFQSENYNYYNPATFILNNQLYESLLVNSYTSTIDLKIKKGSYTKNEFLNQFGEELQIQINENNVITHAENDATYPFFPYKSTSKTLKDGSVFMGLTNRYEVSTLNSYATLGSETTNHNVTREFDDGNDYYFSPTGSYPSFTAMANPLLPYACVNDSNEEFQSTEQSVMYFNIDSPILPSSQAAVQLGFLNTHMTSNLWATATDPMFDTIRTGEEYPMSYFGMELKNLYTSSNVATDILTIFHNGIIDEKPYKSVDAGIEDDQDNYMNDVILDGDHTILTKYSMKKTTQIVLGTRNVTHLSETRRNIRLGVRVYCLTRKELTESEPLALKKDYYFQILGQDTDDASVLVSGETNAVLFDSRNYGLSLAEDLVDAGILLDCCNSSRTAGVGNVVSLGLMPYFFFKESTTGYYLTQVKGTGNGLNIYEGGQAGGPGQVLQSYNMKFPANSVLKNILGVGVTTGGFQFLDTRLKERLNSYFPYLYPTYMVSAGGITNLFSDNIRYNIEIPSLPIRTFNTTSTVDFNLGNERTIIYGTGTFIEGSLDTINNTSVSVNINPSNLKYISLNNNKPIKLNNLNIQIRRANSNEEAVEITDCSIEILIVNPK